MACSDASNYEMAGTCDTQHISWKHSLPRPRVMLIIDCSGAETNAHAVDHPELDLIVDFVVELAAVTRETAILMLPTTSPIRAHAKRVGLQCVSAYHVTIQQHPQENDARSRPSGRI